MNLVCQRHSSLSQVDPASWNAIAGDYPFAQHAFLYGLEVHDCLQSHGWEPAHITAWDDGVLVGAMPLYLKTNSIGEFVFDWSWADAYERAGGRYYPKLVNAIPFAPASGPRFLMDRGGDQCEKIAAKLLHAAKAIVDEQGLSSLHCLFPDDTDLAHLQQSDLLLRSGCQYHWFNRNYADFDSFLASLNSKRRKQIRRERRLVREQNVQIECLSGAQISEEQWQIFHRFYCSTFYKRWGEPRLTLPFFQHLSHTLPEQTLLWLASVDGDYVAGAFAMRSADTLFGRHWGCAKDIDFLHFELCYYATIDYAIDNRLARLNAGAQGEHKIMRGFEAVKTWSGHYIADPGFREAVARFLRDESRQIDQYVQAVGDHVPYRRED